MIPMDEQIATYEAILAEGVERLKAMGFSPTARLGMGAAGQEIAGVAEEIGANLVVVGHRPSGPLARWCRVPGERMGCGCTNCYWPRSKEREFILAFAISGSQLGDCK
jgi:nucleotide-binding universal stress UspA family protein